MLSGNSLRLTVHTHCASVYQAAKLVAAILRIVGVTAGLAESNGSLLPGLWLTSPAVLWGEVSKMAWLASAFSSIRARCPKKVRRRDLTMDESGSWLVMRHTRCGFIAKQQLHLVCWIKTIDDINNIENGKKNFRSVFWHYWMGDRKGLQNLLQSSTKILDVWLYPVTLENTANWTETKSCRRITHIQPL